MNGAIRVAVEAGVGTIVIDQAARRNAMTFAMWRALSEAVNACALDEAVRVIMLRGAGGHFCSGADISEFDQVRATREQVFAYQDAVDAVNDAIRLAPKPVVAAIEGVCYGGGVGIAIHCDLRFAKDDASFAIPAAKLGVAYEYPSVEKLVDLIGPALASEIFFTARPVSSARAERIGLVNGVIAAADFEAAIHDLAATIAGLAPLTHRAIKGTIAAARARPADPALKAETDRLFAACFDSADYKEGRRAFLERRSPRFEGR